MLSLFLTMKLSLQGKLKCPPKGIATLKRSCSFIHLSKQIYFASSIADTVLNVGILISTGHKDPAPTQELDNKKQKIIIVL